ncbi:hypothetical protein [Bernardetia sp.]|uniref:hypothetical protein n=1 Tax=Bernardetia sp. TaxID=1937974 RepID=UPI0025BDD7EC|nr:hypothetical protein [Bernardetia sp.]
MSQSNTNREQKIRSILERSSNIDVQTLQKYIDKKLTKEELHEVEKQLLNSDFAAEAAEGFSNADFKVNIAASTKELNREIKKYNKERGFYKTDYRIYYAAASVALIFVVIFGLMKGIGIGFEREEFAEADAFDTEQTKQQEKFAKEETSNDLALNDEPIVSEEIEKELVEKLEKGEAIKAVDNEESITQFKSNSNSNLSDNNISYNLDESETKQDFSTSDIWIQKKQKLNDNSTPLVASSPTTNENTSNLTDSINLYYNRQLADDDYGYSDKSMGKQKTSQETLSNAMQAYENGKYTDASLLFTTYLASNANDAQALYFGGLSHYKNHDYKTSIGLFERFLLQKSSIIYQKNYQDAEWYLADSYLKQNKKQQAKKLLAKIMEAKGKYANQAKRLLEK